MSSPSRVERERLVRAAVAALLFAAALFLYAVSVDARPGGGQTFGGGSSSRGGGSGRSGGGAGSDGGNEAWEVIFEVAFDLLVELNRSYPAIGIPIDVAIAAAVFLAWRQYGRKDASWSTRGDAAGTSPAASFVWSGAREEPIRARPSHALEPIRARPSHAIRRDLYAAITLDDPSFSLVLFEDFLYALYAGVHEARGKHQLVRLTPYLTLNAKQSLARHDALGLKEVRTVVIGALRYVTMAARSDVTLRTTVTVRIEANYTEVHQDGERCFYVVEDWTLERPPTAKSRPPEKATVIGCPNCGAPLSAVPGHPCTYCQEIVDTGQFDWRVVGITEQKRAERPPQLTSDTPETGTNLPTVVDPDVSVRMEALTCKDPTFQWPRFLSRVGLVFAELQPAWSTLEWARARPFVSDQLFQMLTYWIESYRSSHLRNVTENARITGIELASVVSDRYYDAITVRVRATGLDYTVRDDGEVVSGSKRRERPYTEYWTLIRGASARTKPEDTGKACPNCGAPLAINMAGSCTHCNAKVTSGEFDWVLSRIEQDEAYTG